ncbi:hypothetical protein JAO73_21125 [Hymenobacter sp. BT523]|uniref:hypothetical protein n=1 Tax=Hymenobacter sp. BT523 TaxID=2795725 RepID=UPI0018EB499E|nr:hypothetical protein [Hymenobacter sp. BT523]MBJ6111537.1 hypothetical protein [Hymenobacter sp. BT523]
MKKYFYAVLAASGLLFLNPAAASASLPHSLLIENPAEAKAERKAAKAAAREQAAAAKQVSKMKKLSVKSHRLGNKLEHLMLVVLGMEESKTVTSPRQLKRQLHSHQKQLKTRAKLSARARRSHTHD